MQQVLSPPKAVYTISVIGFDSSVKKLEVVESTTLSMVFFNVCCHSNVNMVRIFSSIDHF
jgi:hypothetical protein